jgi:hypothetical protein
MRKHKQNLDEPVTSFKQILKVQIVSYGLLVLVFQPLHFDYSLPIPARRKIHHAWSTVVHAGKHTKHEKRADSKDLKRACIRIDTYQRLGNEGSRA